MTEAANQPGAAAGATEEVSEFEKLLERDFKPQGEGARDDIKSAVRTLAEQALAGTSLVSDDAVKTIQAIIAAIDAKLTEQINDIIHNEAFRTLEGSWRGLHYLVNNTETDENLKIRVLNISKKDVGKTLKKFKGTAWDQSPLFKQIYETEFGTIGGEPFGALIGDYAFDHTPPDVEILSGIAQIAASAHAPFFAAAAPKLMNMESWKELSDPRDLTKIFQTPDYAPWRSLRESDDSRYIGLTMPRNLARLPYGSKTSPVEEFAFEEDVEGADHNKYVWSNSAYAMGVNINRSFKSYGWCARIRGVESGGLVEGLPCHTFPTDDGGVDMKCPTEIAITDRREAELSKKRTLAAAASQGGRIEAVFLGGRSRYKSRRNMTTPTPRRTPTLAAPIALSLFHMPVCTIPLKCIVRDSRWVRSRSASIWSMAERMDPTSMWKPTPALGGGQSPSRPLAAAEVVVEEVEGNPGYYTSKFFLRPHYQLEGLTVSLRLVSKLPSAKSG